MNITNTEGICFAPRPNPIAIAKNKYILAEYTFILKIIRWVII